MGLRAEYVILGEPTGNLIASAQKGTLVFRVIIRGVSGHSALPSSGRSALHRMVSVVQGWLDSDWGSDPVRGETTLNIGTIRGGVAANVIAPGCEAEGIFRLSGPASETESKLKSDYADDPDISIEILSSSEPLDLMEVPGFEHTVVAFGSDAPFLAGMGKVVMSGPGSISHAHSSEEQVELRELLEGVEVYHRLATLL
jgi:acetylornithine deacetylase